ncbi:MAG: hypothetical protein ACTTKN_05835 [Phocaeicola sp.]|uniref:hypothetical protein n=1 Tax=Phocaeicola TaxID=909656 RepID=UPI00234EC36D|nr:hypothetical protein [Phocaeicola oris]MCE2617204.1 hypothetical protein [Phocaeicola oris]
MKKILYVTASCLSKNTSANMSHNGYIEGLLENSHEVDIIMANDSWGSTDNKLKKYAKANYYEFNSVSIADKLRMRFRGAIKFAVQNSIVGKKSSNEDISIQSDPRITMNQRIRKSLKSIFYFLFKPDPIYPLSACWLQNASKFHSKKEYDLVISNSSPTASHKLVSLLISKNRIKYRKWIQIWEDPWYHDLYGGHSDYIEKEEHHLLQVGQEIYYVSPLTLHYQQIYFPDCADKMHFIPLPFLKFSQDKVDIEDSDMSFGYFGDYYSQTRNLIPFYEALKEMNFQGYIYGDSDLDIQNYGKIKVSGRVTLDVLEKIQDRTSVLVHLCNLRGGQIPGKVYHYSATHKPILFILDGTEEEKKIIKDFFEKFNRYYFCDNNKTDIANAMCKITSAGNINYPIVDAFKPENVVKTLLNL